MRAILVPTGTHGRVLVRDTPAPRGLLVGFHGYMENAQIQMDRLTGIPGADEWTIISVQALNRFYRGRSEDVVAGWMTRQDREAAIEDNIEYVNCVIEAVDPGRLRIVYAGFSQGVAMAFRAAVRGSRAPNPGSTRVNTGPSAVIAVGGDVPPELLDDASVTFPAVLLARGARDDWYTAGKFEADLAALTERGGAVEPLSYDGAHEWTSEISTAAGRLLARQP